MRVAIGGASGRLGRRLGDALESRGDSVVRLVRGDGGAGGRRWDPKAGTIDGPGLSDVDAVVNLAGAGIADKRWTASYKQEILDSRVDSTGTIVKALAQAGAERQCKTFLSASAVGYYGPNCGDRVLTESSPAGGGFLADVCKRWEEAAAPAEDMGVRVAYLRTANVLERGGGLLKALRPLFRMGLGGRIGSGSQWLSWIHVDDHVRAMLYLLDHEVAGPVNLSSPGPVRNREFVDYYGWTLGRPARVPFPRRLASVALSKDMVEETISAGQRALPSVLTESGFVFKYTTVQEALDQINSDTSNRG